ncbi:MAG: IMP dehydrogenase [Patescibacteria group bacterium]|nr:IMP dehydrogenase [Patescibacteria group bacterium]
MAQPLKLSTGFTFDDVLIRPARSSIEPRDAKISTTLAGGFSLAVPFLSAAMDRVTEERMAITLGRMGGLGILHRNCSPEFQAGMVKKVKKAGVLVGAACGPFDAARAELLEESGVDVLVVDCAHGHNAKVIKSAKAIKHRLKRAKMIVGNIATAEAARDLVSFADAIKVGVGPGSICTTRIVSGVGVPQLSAILDVAKVANKFKIPVIADGGIRTSGDIAKAIAAGASAVMIGNLFAGTDEAPGKVIIRDNKKFKSYRGMGSRSVLRERHSSDRYLIEGRKAIPEGVEGLVSYCGPITEIISELISGVQVAMGYVGARTICEFHERAEFIFITSASIRESLPHSLMVLN